MMLEDQDRRPWNRKQIDEGRALAELALATSPGPYALQAAIAAEHARAPRADATDWRAIAGHYDALLRARPSPVIELNRAIAVAMAEGPAAGLALVADLAQRGELADYYLLAAAE